MFFSSSESWLIHIASDVGAKSVRTRSHTFEFLREADGLLPKRRAKMEVYAPIHNKRGSCSYLRCCIADRRFFLTRNGCPFTVIGKSSVASPHVYERASYSVQSRVSKYCVNSVHWIASMAPFKSGSNLRTRMQKRVPSSSE